jgi:signal transduction histidine kinase
VEIDKTNQQDGRFQPPSGGQDLLPQCFEALFAKQRQSYLGGFTQGLIHNINGPMQNMSMLAELILAGQDRENQFVLARCSSELDQWKPIHEKQKQRLRQLSGQITALTEMLRDFMQLSELERSASEVDLNDIVTRLLKALRADLFFKHQVELDLRLAKDLPLIRILAGHLIATLVHLFQNAMLAMRESQEKRLIIETRREGDAIRLTFRDSGCGFSPDQQAHLFDPFFSGWPAEILRSNRQERHFGLGLFAVRYLLGSHGVKVSLEREKQETVATLEIPISRSPPG